MSETPDPTDGSPTPDGPATEPAPGTDTPPTEPDLAAELDKWRSLARKHETRAKENADKAQKFDALEEANKTEQQKLLDRVAIAEQEAAKATASALRAEVASDKGVDKELLSGATREELEAFADRLLAFKGTPPKAPSASGQGNTGGNVNDGGTQITREELKSMSPEDIVKAKAEGRLDDLLKK